LLRLD